MLILSNLFRYILISNVFLLFRIGLCTDHGKINSAIVLSGDPKQLDAVSLSKHASKLGYRMSLMEYLQCNEPCYQPNNITGELNQFRIVQLTKNYRTHPQILQMASVLFYESRLEAKANKGWKLNFSN